jgi:glycosyltransferase involved in cell wall biosynthesis
MKLAILGTRGVPAAHGGFETFAEYLSLYLVSRGWDVTVYCQGGADLEATVVDSWCGVRRVTIPTVRQGAKGTIEFDLKSILHLLGDDAHLVLTLGYNTAAFCLLLRIKGVKNVINMDGIEWKRDKWKPHERAWLWLNERAGCLIGNHLVADHPQIKVHLETRVSGSKITMIPYGARAVECADVGLLRPYGLEAGRFISVIARPEPENSVLDVVQAFSRKKRNCKLVMLGNYSPKENDFHRTVLDAASDEVIFPGAIYDKATVDAIRVYSRIYVHGHRVGGTNPSLIEALGSKSAVLAHDNRFNRWVAGDGARYFSDVDSCESQIESLLVDDNAIDGMKKASWERFGKDFTWDIVLRQYEDLLSRWAAA